PPHADCAHASAWLLQCQRTKPSCRATPFCLTDTFLLPIRRLRPGTNKPPHKNQDHPRQESSRSALLAPAHRTTLRAVNAHERKTKTLRAHCQVTTFAQVEERSQQGHSHSCKHWCSPRHPALVPLSPVSSPAQSATSQVLSSTPRFLNGPSPNTK
ncbi:hypothetical protein C8F01DRAFT_1098067, partial [Mycena amicta]